VNGDESLTKKGKSYALTQDSIPVYARRKAWEGKLETGDENKQGFLRARRKRTGDLEFDLLGLVGIQQGEMPSRGVEKAAGLGEANSQQG